MLTSLAAAVFTVLTFEIFFALRSIDGVNIDPIRLIQAVTAGVAFLAAGTIIHGKGQVEGLTTGAGMWMAGAVGVASGSGFYALAAIAVTLTIAILWLISRIEPYVMAASENIVPGPNDKDN